MTKRSVFLALVASFALACSDDPSENTADAGPNTDCVANPSGSASDIINACTTAQFETKTPVLPLLNADGTLPALP